MYSSAFLLGLITGFLIGVFHSDIIWHSGYPYLSIALNILVLVFSAIFVRFKIVDYLTKKSERESIFSKLKPIEVEFREIHTYFLTTYQNETTQFNFMVEKFDVLSSDLQDLYNITGVFKKINIKKDLDIIIQTHRIFKKLLTDTRTDNGCLIYEVSTQMEITNIFRQITVKISEMTYRLNSGSLFI